MITPSAPPTMVGLSSLYKHTKIRGILTLAICVACWICIGMGGAVQRVGGAITFEGTRYW